MNGWHDCAPNGEPREWGRLPLWWVVPTVMTFMPELTPLMQIGFVGGTIDISTVKAQLKLEPGNNERSLGWRPRHFVRNSLAKRLARRELEFVES